MASTALPRPLLSLLRAGVLLAVAATLAAAQTEFPYAAGTDSTGRAQAVSDATGRVLIESPEFPRGLWVDLVDEAGHALPGIQAEYEGWPDSLVALRCVDPAGLRQETLLWTRPDGAPLQLTQKPDESPGLPAGLTSIDWQIDPSAERLLESTRLIGWSGVEAFLRERWHGWAGWAVVKLDGGAVAVHLDRAEAIERLVTYLQETHQPVAESLAETPIFGAAAVYQTSNLFPPGGVILQTKWFEDEHLETAVREALDGRREVASLTLLEAQERNIHNLAGVGHLTGLDTLDLRDNEIVDVGPLASLTSLKLLRLSSNYISDVGPLASLTSLETLVLSSNYIVDVSPLAALTNLKGLWLTANYVVDVNPLASLTSLERLALSHTDIVDVSPLAALTDLRVLWWSHNDLVDVSPLASLTSLEWLALSHNDLVDVSPLASLPSLGGLYLDSNEIVDVSPLASLTSLRLMQLTDNQIVDVSPLASLTRLEHLELGGNAIVDVSPLVANAGLGEGDSVILKGNPLSDEAINEQIPALRARGVKVTY